MAIVFRESFDTYANNGTTGVGTRQKWVESNTNVGALMALVAGRFGGLAAEHRGSSNSPRRVAYLDAPVSEFSLGFAHYRSEFASWYNNVSQTIYLMNGSNYHLGLTITPLQQIILSLKAGTSEAGALTTFGFTQEGVVHPAEWAYWELEGVIHPTDGELRLYREGQLLVDLAGLNTQGSQGATVNRIGFGQMNNSTSIGDNFLLDDLYVTDSATKLGPCRSVLLAPTADGSNLDFVPDTGTEHFSRVNQVPMSLTGYLNGSTVGDYDLLELADLSNYPAEIHEVNVVGVLSKTDAAARAMSLGLQSNAVDGPSADIYMGTSAARYEAAFPLNPDGDVAWTRSAVNSLLLKPELTV